jgi:hypothetical protein
LKRQRRMDFCQGTRRIQSSSTCKFTQALGNHLHPFICFIKYFLYLLFKDASVTCWIVNVNRTLKTKTVQLVIHEGGIQWRHFRKRSRWSKSKYSLLPSLFILNSELAGWVEYYWIQSFGSSSKGQIEYRGNWMPFNNVTDREFQSRKSSRLSSSKNGDTKQKRHVGCLVHGWWCVARLGSPAPNSVHHRPNDTLGHQAQLTEEAKGSWPTVAMRWDQELGNQQLDSWDQNLES